MHVIPFWLEVRIEIRIHISAHIFRSLLQSGCHFWILKEILLVPCPHPHGLPQMLPANSFLLDKKCLSSHGTILSRSKSTLYSLPGLSNFISCSFLTKFLSTCSLLKIFSSPSVWILSSSESMGTLQKITSLTVHSSTYYQTLTCPAIILLIGDLVSGVISYNPFSAQQPMWSFKNINQIMLVSWLKSSSCTWSEVQTSHCSLWIPHSICHLPASLILSHTRLFPHRFHWSHSVAFCCSNTLIKRLLHLLYILARCLPQFFAYLAPHYSNLNSNVIFSKRPSLDCLT